MSWSNQTISATVISFQCDNLPLFGATHVDCGMLQSTAVGRGALSVSPLCAWVWLLCLLPLADTVSASDGQATTLCCLGSFESGLVCFPVFGFTCWWMDESLCWECGVISLGLLLLIFGSFFFCENVELRPFCHTLCTDFTNICNQHTE